MNIFKGTFRIVAALRIKVEFNLRVEDALRVHKLNYCSFMKEVYADGILLEFIEVLRFPMVSNDLLLPISVSSSE